MNHDSESLFNPPNYLIIPSHMHEGMKRWIENGIEPGGFLQSILKNDFMRAAQQADTTNQNFLFSYTVFLYNETPAFSHGSENNYNNWKSHRGLDGLLEEEDFKRDREN